jgi:uracil-DNA glycosylase
MNVREHLLALHDELRRLKAEGGRTVVVSDAAIARLQRAVRAAQAELGGGAVAPSVVSSGTSSPAPAPAAPAAARADARPGRGSDPIASPAVAPRAEPRPAVAAPAFSLAPIPGEPPVVKLPTGDKPTRWNALRDLVTNDAVCKAHVRPGKKIVLGVGSLDARLFFVGEAPGADEEVQGEPFVGPAGQLLTKMIQGMGLSREQVYIGNIMNWRPEMPVNAGGVQIGNRPPTPEEMNYCLPYLKAQLEIVQPQLIVALGATAAAGLLGQGSFKTLGEVRSKWHTFAGLPVMVTYHPSYILRNQSNRSKRQIWEDLLQVMERAGLPVSEKQRAYFL